jgi:hypothetical protein
MEGGVHAFEVDAAEEKFRKPERRERVMALCT